MQPAFFDFFLKKIPFLHRHTVVSRKTKQNKANPELPLLHPPQDSEALCYHARKQCRQGARPRTKMARSNGQTSTTSGSWTAEHTKTSEPGQRARPGSISATAAPTDVVLSSRVQPSGCHNTPKTMGPQNDTWPLRGPVPMQIRPGFHCPGGLGTRNNGEVRRLPAGMMDGRNHQSNRPLSECWEGGWQRPLQTQNLNKRCLHSMQL